MLAVIVIIINIVVVITITIIIIIIIIIIIVFVIIIIIIMTSIDVSSFLVVNFSRLWYTAILKKMVNTWNISGMLIVLQPITLEMWTNHKLITVIISAYSLQSCQVKRNLLDYINELIIWELNLFVVPNNAFILKMFES